jgi:membrane-associated phospholipid phosphatase
VDLTTLISLATEAAGEEEPSKTPFYVAGIALAVFAVVVSAIGIRSHGHWPSTVGAGRAVTALCVLLVAATMATAVITG